MWPIWSQKSCIVSRCPHPEKKDKNQQEQRGLLRNNNKKGSVYTIFFFKTCILAMMSEVFHRSSTVLFLIFGQPLVETFLTLLFSPQTHVLRASVAFKFYKHHGVAKLIERDIKRGDKQRWITPYFYIFVMLFLVSPFFEMIDGRPNHHVMVASLVWFVLSSSYVSHQASVSIDISCNIHPN